MSRSSRRYLKKPSSFLERVYLSEYLDWFFNIITKYRTYKEMLQRMLFWGWHMRWSWDFDAHTIYYMLLLKLKRLNHVFENHGHCVWNSDRNNKLMRRLREAIELTKRLEEDNYDLCAYKKQPKDFKKRLIAYNKWNKLKQAHKDRLFHLLNKNIELWWD